ncbi:MAG: ArsR/SmtB family transcription factor [Anaerolineae bacterium]
MEKNKAEPDRREIEYIDAERVHKAQAQLTDEPTATQLAQFFQALSNPTRVRIISALSTGELCVYDLATVLGMSQSAISHQLRILRQLRLVKWRKAGQLVYYALDDEHVSVLFRQGLDHVQHH